MSKSQILSRRVVCELHHIYPVDKPVDNFLSKIFQGINPEKLIIVYAPL
jgi:hypothetical protein